MVPAQPHLDALRQTIARLSDQEQAPRFEPHLSLHVNPLDADEDPEHLLRVVARQFAPLMLLAGQTGHSAERFKSLFIRFADTRPAALQDALSRQLKHPQPYSLQPHLSLLYRANLPRLHRQSLARRINFAGTNLLFDTLALVRPGCGEADFTRIESWDSRLRLRLGSADRIEAD